MCVCVSVFITLHACRCLWRPVGGVGSHGTRVTCCEVVSCVIWMLGTKPGSSARPASALKHPAPSAVFLTTRIYIRRLYSWLGKCTKLTVHRPHALQNSYECSSTRNQKLVYNIEVVFALLFATQIVQLLSVNFDDGNVTCNTKKFGTPAKGNVAPMMLLPSNLEPRPQTTAPTGASKDEHQRAAGSTINLALFSKAQGWTGLYEGLTGPSFVSNKDSQRRQWQ